MAKKGKLDIWTQIQNGDKTAFDKVYHLHIDSLYNYGTSLTSDIQLIEDAILEMFINIWTKRSSISFNSNIKGYLFTSPRRQIITQVEKQKKTVLKDDFIDKMTYQKTVLTSSDHRMDQVKKKYLNYLAEKERPSC